MLFRILKHLNLRGIIIIKTAWTFLAKTFNRNFWGFVYFAAQLPELFYRFFALVAAFDVVVTDASAKAQYSESWRSKRAHHVIN